MIRYLLPLVFAITGIQLLRAQTPTETVKGKVIDKDSHQPLSGVNIMIMGTNPPQGAVTDDNGSFRIEKVTIGRHTLRFSYIGYEDAMASEVLVSSGVELTLNMEMTEKVTSMNEVVVTGDKDKAAASNEYATVSARTFSAEEMSRYAATQNDPARMVQSFAGVMTSGDDNNQIVVRGNSPRGILWEMEGIEIPNPNHFADAEGSTGGGVSILSAATLANTDFYSGAFPAQYGDALSGVFDLNLRKGNSDTHEFTFQAGVLGLEAALEGPWSNNYQGSYLINYRYSTLELLSLMGLKIGGDVLPAYQDVTFNFFFPTKKAGSFTFFGIGGTSSLAQHAVHDTAQWPNVDAKTEYSQTQWYGVLGLTYTYPFRNNKTYLKAVVSYSYTNNQDTNDTLSDEFVPFNLGGDKFIYQTYRATVVVNHKFSARDQLRAGVIYTNMGFNLFSNQYSYQYNQLQTQVDNVGNTSMAEAYLQAKHRFTEKFSLNYGVHYTVCFLNNKQYPEPRLGGQWNFRENQSLSFGLGLHSRIDDMSIYYSYTDTINGQKTYPNRSLGFSRSFHAVLGYNFSFKKDYHLKIEGYAQYLFKVPIGADTADVTYSILNYNSGFVTIPLENKGAGYNYGLEITMEKFFSQHFFFMYTASLYESMYKAADDIWRPTMYDVHYVMNLLGGKEFVLGPKKIHTLGFDIKLVWRGGERYTPVDEAASIAQQNTVYDNNEAFTQKYPDYFRIDFGIYLKRDRPKYSWTWSFDCQNIINRMNVEDEVFDPGTQSVIIERNLGIVPVFSWKIQLGVKGNRVSGMGK